MVCPTTSQTTTRPTVLAIPITAIRKAALFSWIPNMMALSGKKVYGTQNPMLVNRFDMANIRNKGFFNRLKSIICRNVSFISGEHLRNCGTQLHDVAKSSSDDASGKDRTLRVYILGLERYMGMLCKLDV